MRWGKVAALCALSVFAAERAVGSGSIVWGCLWGAVTAVSAYAAWATFHG